MAQTADFQELICLVRAGDEDAAAQLVRQYEPYIRRRARVRLLGSRLRRRLDSLDICQSVLASFFVRAGLGQYELDTPEQLMKLLAVMVRNKVVNQAEKQQADCRDIRRDAAAGPQAQAVASGAESPSYQLEARELLAETVHRLSPEELQLFELRRQGCAWAAVADRLGGTAEGRRKQYERAVQRVTHELHLED
jgi:RNA polymerase sigma-70 factor (ECF subfamily)